MTFSNRCRGVLAAAITPVDNTLKPAYESIPIYLSYLAEQGCHGALLLGTTGEGPSFDYKEKVGILQSGILIRQKYPQFFLFAGCGTPSLEESCALTRMAFDLDYDGVVVLPPYYYKKATMEGLLDWFSRLITKAVPSNKIFLGYHIPELTGNLFSIELIRQLKDKFPDRFSGIKDSTTNLDFSLSLLNLFGGDFQVYTGNDTLFGNALKNQTSGCISAGANIFGSELRKLWDAYILDGEINPEIENEIIKKREIMWFIVGTEKLTVGTAYFLNF